MTTDALSDELTHCRYCNALIRWGALAGGARLPFEPQPVDSAGVRRSDAYGLTASGTAVQQFRQPHLPPLVLVRHCCEQYAAAKGRNVVPLESVPVAASARPARGKRPPLAVVPVEPVGEGEQGPWWLDRAPDPDHSPSPKPLRNRYHRPVVYDDTTPTEAAAALRQMYTPSDLAAIVAALTTEE